MISLHNHSHYSLQESTQSPLDILTRAQALGHTAVALTDTNNGYGLLEFYEKSKKLDNIKPILGIELAYTIDGRFEKRSGIDGEEGYIVLLAKTNQGFQNLLKLITYANTEGFFNQPRIDQELLEKYHQDLICLTGSTEGNLCKIYTEQGESKAFDFLKKLKNIFHDQLYLEITARHFPEQKRFNEFIIKLKQKTQIKLIVSSDSRYTVAENEIPADTLYCIGKNQTIDDPRRIKFLEKNWFKTEE